MILRIDKPTVLTNSIEKFKKQGQTVGFVPTMGALHAGHLSLVHRSCLENDLTVVSIFVNPTQFNDKEDFLKYPKLVDKDIESLSETKADIVFIPDVEDMYPDNHFEVAEIDLEGLDTVLEGAHRPGHFAGVVTIVGKLFDIVMPDNAYFGLKDYQQYIIIKKMTEKLGLGINIIPCPTMREPDGLAMSSRNLLLSEEERKFAPNIYKTLIAAQEMLFSKSVNEIKNQSISFLTQSPLVNLDYFEIVDAGTLKTVEDVNEHKEVVICTAMKVGKIRLIDNVKVSIR